MSIEIIHGDCLEKLKNLEDNSVDSIVTDPPYGLSVLNPKQVSNVLSEWISGNRESTPKGKGFMGKSWDVFVPPPAVWDECLRVLKPGGYMAVFSGARTQDLMGLSIRLSGFEIKDTLGWIRGDGFPKSMDISKAIDKELKKEREVIEEFSASGIGNGTTFRGHSENSTQKITKPNSEEAKNWEGWGTALKPAIEPIILARKPLSEKTIAGNVLIHGTGGLNIDSCRVGNQLMKKEESTGGFKSSNESMSGQNTERRLVESKVGRFPPNVLLGEYAAYEVDKQSGIKKSTQSAQDDKRQQKITTDAMSPGFGNRRPDNSYSDSGGASRFFPVFKYEPKARKSERPFMLDENEKRIAHPTVKPVKLLEWIVSLITPPGGKVLEPFAGSGSTLEAARNKGFSAIGIEREEDYIKLIHSRLKKIGNP